MVNIKSIWDSQISTSDIIIKTKIEDISHLNCYAATNHITGQHLFIFSVSKDIEIPELKNYRFRGVEVFPLELENNFELNIYLLDSDLKDIFSLFIQNILEDIAECATEKEALTKILNVVAKWKKLFDKINFNGLNNEQQKGLIGELLFFNYLLDNQKMPRNVLNAWSGAKFKDKDFTFGTTEIEIKFTTSKTPKLTVTSERQLDTQNLDELFLVLYAAEEVRDNGFSLNSMVEQVRYKLSANIEELNFFNEMLSQIGYFEEDKIHYNKMYSLKKSFNFIVASNFPRIVKSQISLSIYNVSYSIELSAIEKFIVTQETILQQI